MIKLLKNRRAEDQDLSTAGTSIGFAKLAAVLGPVLVAIVLIYTVVQTFTKNDENRRDLNNPKVSIEAVYDYETS